MTLLAELILDAADKRRVSVSGSALDGASGGAIGSVSFLFEKRGKARNAA